MYEAFFGVFGCLLKRSIYLPKFLFFVSHFDILSSHRIFSHISSVTHFVSLYKETQQWYLTSILTDSTTYILHSKIGFGKIAYISDISFQAYIDKKRENFHKKPCCCWPNSLFVEIKNSLRNVFQITSRVIAS